MTCHNATYIPENKVKRRVKDPHVCSVLISSARTNLKVGGHWFKAKVGGTDLAQSAGKNFFGGTSPLFGSKSTISRFGEHFRDGQNSLVSFLFSVLLLTVPLPCPAICKSGGGGTCPLCPMESEPLVLIFFARLKFSH